MTRSRGGRSSRRHGRSDAETKPGIAQSGWQIPEYLDLPTEPLDDEGVERIHEAAMQILEEIGIDFLHSDAREILKQAGCDIDSDSPRVRMDRALVTEYLRGIPAGFTIKPRNPDRSLYISPKTFVFGQVASPPNVADLDRGRRTGNREDFQNLVRLAQYFNCIHFHGGYPVEPVDIHPSVRHLDALHDLLVLSDKVVHAYSLGTERIEDAMEMVRIAADVDDVAFESTPHLFTNINSSSPLKHDWPMLDGAMRMARRGQLVVVTPFTLSGAMAPVTLAGAIAQQTAEALSAIVLLQLIRPGVPVMLGGFTSNVDMKSGAPAFGTPEYMRAMQMTGQLARRYGIPWRGSNANAANFPDAQATWESCNSLFGVMSGRANMVFHGAGWMEGGLTASFEKFVMDCELIQQMIYYQQPVSTNDDELAIEAIREVGSEGHFLGCSHTQARYKTAFYSPMVSDWRNYEAWEEAGSPTAHSHANALWKRALNEYVEPPMDAAIKEALEDFVLKRKEEGGAPTDY